MHELFTVLKLTENLISLAVLYASQSFVQCACQLAAAARTLNLLVLLCRPHPSMYVGQQQLLELATAMATSSLC